MLLLLFYPPHVTNQNRPQFTVNARERVGGRDMKHDAVHQNKHPTTTFGMCAINEIYFK